MAEQEHAESFGNRAATVVNQPLTPFHIAVQVRDIAEARRFYKDILGCAEGRSDSCWVDFNLYGHQFVCHLNAGLGASGKFESHFNFVDGHGVPVPHCGVVLRPAQWLDLAERVRRAGVKFVIEPYTRFRGQAGEQSTMFFLDPSGNALEFKAFQDIGSQLFAVDQAAR
jgi:extradiol dioxygenase family protein